MGKTAFALNVAWNAAEADATVAFFSLEMSRQELLVRLVASVGRVDGHRLASGTVNQTDYGRIAHSFGQIGASGLFVDDSTSLGVLDVLGKARRLKAKRGLRLIVIDYLQLMQIPRAENRNLALADASRSLKLISKELDVPIVLLSQLSRDPEKRGGNHRPILSDLRDSGALEQDADVVMFIHRPEVYENPPNPAHAGLAELIIAKHRNGPIGTIELDWIKTQTRFDNRGHS